jgi:hypothetical protein
MSRADIYREAISLIQECGAECDPKAFAFCQSTLFFEHGNFEEATRWAKIADAIDDVLCGVTTLEHIPAALH